MGRSLTITKEGKWIIATDNVTGVASQGVTEEDALTNLREALGLYYEDFSDDEKKKRIVDDFLKRVDPYSPPPKMPFTLKEYNNMHNFSGSTEQSMTKNIMENKKCTPEFPDDAYQKIIYYSSFDECWIVKIPELPGCMADGATREEALHNSDIIAHEWIETAIKLGRPIQCPNSYSEQYPFPPAAEECLNKLGYVISRHFSSDVYHIGGYQEAALCIQPLGNDWIVYHGERGNMYDMIKCDNVLMACILFIHKITHDITLKKEMEDDFIRCVQTIAKE